MSYLFGRAYRGFKWGVSGMGGVGGAVGIVYGVASGGSGAIIWGSLLATQSLVIAMDNYRAGKDLDNYVDEQRSAWKSQKEQLDDIITAYTEEHARFLDSVQQSDAQLTRMKEMQSEMGQEREEERFEYEEQIESLRERLVHLGELEAQYRHENARLGASIAETQEQIGELSDENERLRAIEDGLREQVTKLRDLHEQSKQLLKNLVLAGDTFTQFENTFGNATNRLDNTSARVEDNVEDLQNTIALLKDVAAQLHTEHVRSLGFTMADPEPEPLSSSSSSSSSSSLSGGEEDEGAAPPPPDSSSSDGIGCYVVV